MKDVCVYNTSELFGKTHVFKFDNVDPGRWLYNLKEPGA